VIAPIESPNNIDTNDTELSEHNKYQHISQSIISNALPPVAIQAESSISISGSDTDEDTQRYHTFREYHPPYVSENATIITKDTHTHSAGTSHPFSLDAASPLVMDLNPRQAPSIISQEDSRSAISILSGTLTSDAQYSAGPKAVFEVLPSHVAATCPLDQILLSFLTYRRNMIYKGVLQETVLGPQRASFKAIFHPELADSVHPLSKVMTEVMSTYPLIGKVEQVGLTYLMHQTMRVSLKSTLYDRTVH
jgi:hypothetical protein